jgi:hypothetical protein
MGDLFQELSDFSDSWDGSRHANLRDFLDGFSMGDPLTVSEYPHAKPSDVMLSRVDPVETEIWSFRCLYPPPGVRVLGHFAAKDCFVALGWNYRENIDGNEGWDDIIKECKSVWRDLFGDLPPHQGSYVSDYLSSNFWIDPATPRRKGSKRNV